MKTATSFATIMLGALCSFTALICHAQNLDSMPPVVIKTFPEAGARDVSPGVVEIRVTFSKEMKDHTWSWSTAWQESTPEIVEKPKYDADRKTCVLKVRLEANKTYGYWLNSQQFKNFKDQQGQAAVPYLLAFQTKGN